eukprot:487444_1
MAEEKTDDGDNDSNEQTFECFPGLAMRYNGDSNNKFDLKEGNIYFVLRGGKDCEAKEFDLNDWNKKDEYIIDPKIETEIGISLHLDFDKANSGGVKGGGLHNVVCLISSLPSDLNIEQCGNDGHYGLFPIKKMTVKQLKQKLKQIETYPVGSSKQLKLLYSQYSVEKCLFQTKKY